MSALAGAGGSQGRARAALEAALREGPSHAYLFTGPVGSGKAALARAFAAEMLADNSPDPEETRRRAALDPSPHPDLVWLRPVGMSHAVADVRERLIQRAPLRPFEGDRRVFVIEAAEALNEESQNAMLKTLEEPPAHAVIILLSAEPESVLPTVASRCQEIAFDPLPEDEVVARMPPGTSEQTARAVARLARGDVGRARFLCGNQGSAIRASVERMMSAVLADQLADSPWKGVLDEADRIGKSAGEKVAAELAVEKEEGYRHTKTEVDEATRRATRRAKTGVLDLALTLAGSWARDWAAVSAGAEETAFNPDRLELLREQASRTDIASARDAVTLIAETRRRFELNVSEELALEALCFRLESRLRPGAAVDASLAAG
jgi:DNA polymerase-3 subunit delta'